jgi:hypothetical protein
VKMIAEYLEHALQFERMAADEKNPELKAQLERQAAAIASWRRSGRKSWARSHRLRGRKTLIKRAASIGSSGPQRNGPSRGQAGAGRAST